jgi:high affinity Mn2+ porin
MKQTNAYTLFIITLLQYTTATAQDTVQGNKLSFHWQATVIPQYHFNFQAPYAGDNSMLGSEPVQTSFTSTLYLAYKPAKNTYIVFNPELAGGKGLSKTLGVAGFPNGEVYRVGDPKPQIFIGRLYLEHRFPLSKKIESVETDLNVIKENTYSNYISILIGKFSLTDFFDDSQISHDPRTQFMNWSLMGNGAWDYAANTRGYTMGLVIQALYKDVAFRFAHTAVPMEANGPELQYKGTDASSTVFEFEKTRLFKKSTTKFTTFHTGLYVNKARMGNYATSIKTGSQNFTPPDIEDSRQYGRTKWGYYASFDNHFNKIHHFIKGSWNDGENESWAFTEIDKSIATGLKFDGNLWKRNNDHFSIAFVANGLSDEHKKYLENGGYGFIIGDGKLNYASEQIIEAYYSCKATKLLTISTDYQFIKNPAYNKDRGPVNCIALRLHFEF